MKYSPRFPKQVPLCWLSCKTASSFPHQPQATLASLQPRSEFQFTALTCGQLYLDCKVMRGDCCTFSIAVVLPMLANTPELFLSSKKCLTLTSTPCNGSAGRRSPGLWASDLQILLLQPSWQWFARKRCILTGLLHKDLLITSTHDRCEPLGWAEESSTAGTFKEWSLKDHYRAGVQEETSAFQHGDALGPDPATLTSSQGKEERNL